MPVTLGRRKPLNETKTSSPANALGAFTTTIFIPSPPFPAQKTPDLAETFREFRPYLDKCRFQGCAHVKEQGCAVLEFFDALTRLRAHPQGGNPGGGVELRQLLRRGKIPLIEAEDGRTAETNRGMVDFE